jgi:hypothetical protein
LWAKAPKQSSSESQFTVLGDCLQVWQQKWQNGQNNWSKSN